MSARKSLTYTQRKEIDLYLGTVIKKFGEGLCEYIGGESDQTVATKFDCTPNNVQGVREAVYGRLRPPAVRSPVDDRVDALETRVARLEAMVIEITGRLDKDLPAREQQAQLPLKAAE